MSCDEIKDLIPGNHRAMSIDFTVSVHCLDTSSNCKIFVYVFFTLQNFCSLFFFALRMLYFVSSSRVGAAPHLPDSLKASESFSFKSCLFSFLSSLTSNQHIRLVSESRGRFKAAYPVSFNRLAA